MDILIVNSDTALESELQGLLAKRGHRVWTAASVAQALALLERQPVDLLIADCGVLELSGAALFRGLARLSHSPMILPTSQQTHVAPALSGRVEWVHDVVAQVQRLLNQPLDDSLQVGDLTIDAAGKRVLLRGQPVWLPPTQFRMLAYLARHAGRVVSAQELLRAVWGYEEKEAEARELVKVHVRQIRRRLGMGADGAGLVRSVRGFGYTVPSPED
ncbi:MAG: response regulator transcription factor [Anaerolineae bacterium]